MSSDTSQRRTQRPIPAAAADLPHSGVVTVSQVAATGAAMLALVCDRCGRRGRLGVARLLRERGPSTSLPTIAQELTADCPRRGTRDTYNRCDPYWPGLAALLMD